MDKNKEKIMNAIITYSQGSEKQIEMAKSLMNKLIDTARAEGVKAGKEEAETVFKLIPCEYRNPSGPYKDLSYCHHKDRKHSMCYFTQCPALRREKGE